MRSNRILRLAVASAAAGLASATLALAVDAKIAGTLDGHTAAVYSVTWSPDGTKVVTGALRLPTRRSKVWDPATPATIKTLPGHTDIVLATLAIDGARASASCRGARTNQYGSGRCPARSPLRPWPTRRASTRLALRPDGKEAVAASGKALTFWDLDAGKAHAVDLTSSPPTSNPSPGGPIRPRSPRATRGGRSASSTRPTAPPRGPSNSRPTPCSASLICRMVRGSSPPAPTGSPGSGPSPSSPPGRSTRAATSSRSRATRVRLGSRQGVDPGPRRDVGAKRIVERGEGAPGRGDAARAQRRRLAAGLGVRRTSRSCSTT